jgi:hypothetical protein
MEDNSNPQPDLLYFFLSEDRLMSLYKTLFIDNKISMPFHVLSDKNYSVYLSNYTSIEYILSYGGPKIFDIKIKVENRKLKHFTNKMMFTNTNNHIKKGARVFGDTIYYNYEDLVDDDDLEKLQTKLKIEDIERCNVICRFFLVDKKRDITNENIYKDQFNIDVNNIKNIYIADDMMFDNSYTTKFLEHIFSQQNLSSKPEIILLPCLHRRAIDGKTIRDGESGLSYTTSTNYCDNNGNINPLCQSFDVIGLAEPLKINTNIYTTFYGTDKVRKTNIFKTNIFKNHSRQRCRDNTFIGIALKHFVNDKEHDTNTHIDDNYSYINRIEEEYDDNTEGGRRKSTKRSKKTRKPRKRSRKTRKHKKSRKH